MSKRVKYVVTAQKWDDNFEEVFLVFTLLSNLNVELRSQNNLEIHTHTLTQHQVEMTARLDK